MKAIRIMCILCTPRPIHQSTCWPTLDQCIGHHIDRVLVTMPTNILVTMPTNISVESRSICWLRCVGWHIDRCISAEWWSTYRLPISRYLGWYSGQQSANKSKWNKRFLLFLVEQKASRGKLGFLHMLFLESEGQIDQSNYGTMRFMSKQVSLWKISSILQKKMKIGQKPTYTVFARRTSIVILRLIFNV